MGCNQSSDEVSAAVEAEQVVAPITILVTGKSGSGVTSLCRRFTDKEFNEAMPKGTLGTGTRDVTVNGQAVPVTVLDCDDESSRPKFCKVDAILYPVDTGDEVEEPFDGIFKRIQRLYLSNDRARAYMLQNSVSLTHSGSFGDDSASELRAAHVSVGSLGPVQWTKASKEAHDQYGVVGTDVSGAGGGVGAVGGAPGSDTSSTSRVSPPHVDASAVPGLSARKPSLSIRTKKSPQHSSQGTRQPIQDSIPPLHVMLTKADKLVEAGDRHRICRVRAMASNWSLANRCSVSFVSSKTGQGLEEALGALIRDIVWRRHAERVAAAQMN